ncbi:hypothetical protein ACFQ6S_07270 [Streptomyces sp. NPDC056479]|uniref:hypothetical protein n=1 Tax=Streptomyces sp. NPDC056479 TaxID=3345832 RepID=UPI0036810E80
MAAEDTMPAAGMPEGEPTAAQSAPGLPGERVERTGIALVHEGEYIVPAPGSEAVLSPAAGTGPVVNYYFPVEVELVGDLDDTMVRRVVAGVFAELDRELSSRL